MLGTKDGDHFLRGWSDRVVRGEQAQGTSDITVSAFSFDAAGQGIVRRWAMANNVARRQFIEIYGIDWGLKAFANKGREGLSTLTDDSSARGKQHGVSERKEVPPSTGSGLAESRADAVGQGFGNKMAHAFGNA